MISPVTDAMQQEGRKRKISYAVRPARIDKRQVHDDGRNTHGQSGKERRVKRNRPGRDGVFVSPPETRGKSLLAGSSVQAKPQNAPVLRPLPSSSQFTCVPLKTPAAIVRKGGFSSGKLSQIAILAAGFGFPAAGNAFDGLYRF